MGDRAVCTDANDCNVGQFCYDDIEEGSLLCDCSNWYGWQGENCDEESAGLTVIRFSKIIIFVLAVFALVLISRTMFYNIFLGDNPDKLKDPILYTGGFIMLSVIGLLVDATLNLIGAFDPTFFQTIVYRTVFFSNDPTVNVKGGFTSPVALSLSFMFYALAALSTMLSWYAVIDRVSRFQTLEWQAKMKRWSRRVRIFMGVLLAIMLILLFIGFFAAILVMVTIVFLALSVVNFVVGKLFIETLVKFNAENTSSASLSINLIQSSFKVYRVCCPLFCVAIFAFFFSLLDYQDNSEYIGDFNFSLLFRDIANLIGLYLLVHTSWYVNSVTEGALLDNTTSCCFNKWDAQNLKIMGAVLSSEADDVEMVSTTQIDTVKKEVE